MLKQNKIDSIYLKSNFSIVDRFFIIAIDSFNLFYAYGFPVICISVYIRKRIGITMVLLKIEHIGKCFVGILFRTLSRKTITYAKILLFYITVNNCDNRIVPLVQFSYIIVTCCFSNDN